jgi:hypothetical protein
MFAYAGFLYVTAAARTENLQKAKSVFTSVLVGFVLVLGAVLIVDVVLSVLTEKDFGYWSKIECANWPTLGDASSNTTGGISVVSASLNDGVLSSIPTESGDLTVKQDVTPKVTIPEDTSYEDGLLMLQQIAGENGEDYEQLYAYIQNKDGSGKWVFLGEGTSTNVVIGDTTLQEVIEAEIANNDVDVITIFHTHPYASHDGKNDQSMASLNDMNFALGLQLAYKDTGVTFQSGVVTDTAVIFYSVPENSTLANEFLKEEYAFVEYINTPSIQQEYIRLEQGEYSDLLINRFRVMSAALDGELGPEGKAAAEKYTAVLEQSYLAELRELQGAGRLLELQREYENSGASIEIIYLPNGDGTGYIQIGRLAYAVFYADSESSH